MSSWRTKGDVGIVKRRLAQETVIERKLTWAERLSRFKQVKA